MTLVHFNNCPGAGQGEDNKGTARLLLLTSLTSSTINMHRLKNKMGRIQGSRQGSWGKTGALSY